MSIIKPFRALRPQAQFAKQVASKPYDVLSSSEARIEAQGNPASFLHITKSEIDLPPKTDAHAKEVYEQAKQNLTAFIKRDILFRENKECFYVYRLTMQGRSQTGLVCVSSLSDYENNIIKKHELTRPDKEKDRINHIKFTGAQTGNVFLAYRNVEALDNIISKWTSNRSPVYNFIAADDVEHAVWIINDSDCIEKITDIFKEKVEATYIADGHHRAASAAKVNEEPAKDTSSESGFFLTTLFPASQLQILDYNRVVKNLNGLSVEAFIDAIQKNFAVEEHGAAPFKPHQLHEFGLYVDKTWYKLQARPGTYADNSIESLDISILQKNILAPLLNIHDQRNDGNIDFVGGIRGLEELETRVNSGEMAAAFSLYPVSIEQLFAVADSGQVMPPKSTWFEPKLRDGLLTHLIYE